MHPLPSPANGRSSLFSFSLEDILRLTSRIKMKLPPFFLSSLRCSFDSLKPCLAICLVCAQSHCTLDSEILCFTKYSYSWIFYPSMFAFGDPVKNRILSRSYFRLILSCSLSRVSLACTLFQGIIFTGLYSPNGKCFSTRQTREDFIILYHFEYCTIHL